MAAPREVGASADPLAEAVGPGRREPAGRSPWRALGAMEAAAMWSCGEGGWLRAAAARSRRGCAGRAAAASAWGDQALDGDPPGEAARIPVARAGETEVDVKAAEVGRP